MALQIAICVDSSTPYSYIVMQKATHVGQCLLPKTQEIKNLLRVSIKVYKAVNSGH